MDIKDIRRIIEMMKQNELCEFELQDEGFRIAIKRKNGGDSQIVVSPPQAQMMVPAHMAHVAPAPAAPAAPAEAAPADGGEDVVEDGFTRITSPMVGTFYRASVPDSEPFVSVGTDIEEGAVVCIVEAMKVMNEIKAETSGVVRKILVENGSPVQFGQALFLVEPS